VVVWVGETLAVPETGRGEDPTEGLMLTLDALLLVQVSVALCPAVMVVADDCKLTDGGFVAGGAADAAPPHPLNVVMSPKQRQQRPKTSEFFFKAAAPEEPK
jgi:hypothetical protein